MRRPSLKPVLDIAKKVCPNPNASLTLSVPPKLTFGCR